MKRLAPVLLAWGLMACEGDMNGRPDDAGELEVDAALTPDAATRPDAGPTDAGVDPDAGATPEPDTGVPPDAGVIASAGCEGRDALFCDDFELSRSLEEGPWTLVTRDGTRVERVESGAYEGIGAVRIRMPTVDGARGLMRLSELFPVRPNRFYMRYFMRTTPAVDTVHHGMLYASNAAGTTYYGLHANAGRINTRYVAPDVTVHGGLRYLGAHRVPVDEWMCIEVLFDGEADAVRVWIDDEEDPSMRVGADTEPPWPAPEFARLDLGMVTYQAASAPFEVWYDAVVIDDERIGCGAPP
ncbi:MAG: hypothetical protein R3B99_15020 [Polyangiales bacterium]